PRRPRDGPPLGAPLARHRRFGAGGPNQQPGRDRAPLRLNRIGTLRRLIDGGMPRRPILCDDRQPAAMQCPSCQAEVADATKFCPSCGTALAPTEGSEPGPDVMIGQTLGGKYKVVRLLGEGGMGAVYEGEQQLGTAKRKVAVKTLHPHLSRDPMIKARF